LRGASSSTAAAGAAAALGRTITSSVLAGLFASAAGFFASAGFASSAAFLGSSAAFLGSSAGFASATAAGTTDARATAASVLMSTMPELVSSTSSVMEGPTARGGVEGIAPGPRLVRVRAASASRSASLSWGSLMVRMLSV
jgi:hypothetical protein